MKSGIATLALCRIFVAIRWLLPVVRCGLSCKLLKSVSACGDHVPPRAAQANRTLLIGVAFKDRYYVDKARERFESKNRGDLRLLRGW